jgi:exopolyphosphatase/guanosine-5'-triphosphate,3'-diphosphate pyrophosphatase
LREGVVLDHLRRHYSEADLDRVEIKPWVTRLDSPDELPSIGKGGEDNLDVRSRSTLSLARRYQYDAPHAHLVAKLATQIFNDTLPLHGMGPADLRLLQHAAVLHDIGYHIAHNNHHRHALYLIRNSDMPGFTGAETALMATVVRYHRGSIPRKTSDVRGRPEHEDFVALDRAQRATVRRLASILQIADGLDRSNRQLVANVRCEIAASQATFYIESEDDCELEIWSARRKSRWFSDIFGMDVDFIRVGFGDEHDPDQAPAAADSIVDS